MSSMLRLLILEDDQYDAQLILSELKSAGYTCQWQCVATRDDFLKCLDDTELDLILADYSLPNFDGLSALRLVLDKQPDLPFILVSGMVSAEVAVDCLHAGATDYVLKDRLARLVPAVERALREKVVRREHEQVEAVTYHRALQRKALHEMSLEMAAQLDLETLLPIIVARGIDLVGGDAGDLYLNRTGADSLEWQLSANPNAEPSPSWRKAIAAQVWQTGEQLMIENYQDNEPGDDNSPWTAVIASPIRFQSTFFGVLIIKAEKPGMFSQADGELLGQFTTLAALAIRNARLFAQARQPATDR